MIVITEITDSYYYTERLQHDLDVKTKEVVKIQRDIIASFAAMIEARDGITGLHIKNTGNLVTVLVNVMKKDARFADKITDEYAEMTAAAARLHDIGKIAIPDRILNKDNKLTDEEYAVMKSHVVRGGEILKNFTLVDHVYEGALYHHERYDGKGYVQGLKGEKIPLNARIIGIADAFDAMTANRVYRKKLDMEFVLNEIKKGRGTQFDPMLVDIMLDLIEDGTIDVQKIYAP